MILSTLYVLLIPWCYGKFNALFETSHEGDGLLTLHLLDCFSICLQMSPVHVELLRHGVVGDDSINIVRFVDTINMVIHLFKCHSNLSPARTIRDMTLLLALSLDCRNFILRSSMGEYGHDYVHSGASVLCVTLTW